MMKLKMFFAAAALIATAAPVGAITTVTYMLTGQGTWSKDGQIGVANVYVTLSGVQGAPLMTCFGPATCAVTAQGIYAHQEDYHGGNKTVSFGWDHPFPDIPNSADGFLGGNVLYFGNNSSEIGLVVSAKLTTLTVSSNESGGALGYLSVSWGNGVPEPASWAMMIGGFAFVGATMRRRQSPFGIIA